jgi:probable HAF family extracellular repeat protein
MKSIERITLLCALAALAAACDSEKRLVGVGASIAASGGVALAEAGTYTATDLGTLGGAQSTACGNNDSGQVTGSAATATGQVHTFLWQAGVMTDLGTLPGKLFSEGRALNNRGEIAGDASNTGGPPFAAAMWGSQGGIVALPRLPGGPAAFAININNRSEVVGASRNLVRDLHAVIWKDGTVTDLGTLLSTDHQSIARSINNRGQVVGNSSPAFGDPPPPPVRAFFWQDGQFSDMGSLGGTWGAAYSINEPGEAVGGSFLASGEMHAFLWKDEVISDLGTLSSTLTSQLSDLSVSCTLGTDLGASFGTFSLATSINNSGLVVGRSRNAVGNDRAVLWSHGTITDLNDQIPSGSGWTLVEASSINSSGQIVGYGRIGGQNHAFLLTPND